jgi:DNA-binding LytR/AlgR family response regulator
MRKEGITMRTVLIIEDNAASMEMLAKIVNEVDPEIVVHRAVNQNEAYAHAMRLSIDLFLIDIILEPKNPGDVSGMRFANRIRLVEKYRFVPMIFITALEDAQLYAYSNLHCYYYLEKPFDAKKARQVITEALEMPLKKNSSHDVFFRKDGIIFKKDISEVVYIENVRSGQTVCFVDGKLKLQYKPSKVILEELDSDKFLQCSRYAIVNRDFIEAIDIVNRYIELKDNFGQLEIGISFKKKFIEALKGN